MPKERPVPSNRTRVSPYPLRSTRTQKEPIEAPGPSQWEDVMCVICQEVPHNAVLLRCSSSSNGCRAYMCDTNFRHSNCFKQYRKKNMSRVTKVLNCPYCRGEVHEAMKVQSGGRRAMNAKPRSCAFENCNFSGTYSQLKNHLKADHPGSTRPLVDQERVRAWEQMQRATEHNDIMTAAGLSHALEVSYEQLPNVPPRLVILHWVNGVVLSILHYELPNSLPQSFVVRAGVNGVVRDYLLRFNGLDTTLPLVNIIRRWTL
ncbi:hypothetical protein BRARA_B02515 [Brassica rapa]|nr:uncharacterized protein LOC106408673 [Brassica napus]XP_033140156.1 uncharacterized protein LOC103853461 [Brassica rapa]XP_048611976.1 uncharacterized protein LOC125586187 [Brassica napus]RID75471.1 hypothetical protein BRARA_B02515 [Brassica rapa]CAF2141077.1 unnamed protein product [Brassica napus]CAG7893993.1 unnamed protein product [Brassica rapa]VDC89524.1 unnamed protein product [Brassica rapa]